MPSSIPATISSGIFIQLTSPLFPFCFLGVAVLLKVRALVIMPSSMAGSSSAYMAAELNNSVLRVILGDVDELLVLIPQELKVDVIRKMF